MGNTGSYKLDFKNPSDIYRVFVVILLSVIVSHVVYMYLKMPKGLPISTDALMLAGMLIVACLALLAWTIWSNSMDIELAWRFGWAAAMAVLFHRTVVYDNEVGGSLYAQSLMFVFSVTALIFVLSGKTKSELKIWFNVKWNEGKNEKGKVLTIANSDDNSNAANG